MNLGDSNNTNIVNLASSGEGRSLTNAGLGMIALTRANSYTGPPRIAGDSMGALERTLTLTGVSANTNRIEYSSRANRARVTNFTIKANIAGMGGISKHGRSPLILSASTNYAGEAIVTVGDGKPRATGALGVTSCVTVFWAVRRPRGVSGRIQRRQSASDDIWRCIEKVSDSSTYAGLLTMRASPRIVFRSGKGEVGQWHFDRRRPSGSDREEQQSGLIGLDSSLA